MSVSIFGSFAARLRHGVSSACLIVFGLLVPFNGGAARAQTVDYRSPESAPPTWGAYAGLVKLRFEEAIGADDDVAKRFRAWLTSSADTPEAPPTSVIVRVWLHPDGRVARVIFPALPNDAADGDLHAILLRSAIGQRPPTDMLQPLNLRFSLNLPT